MKSSVGEFKLDIPRDRNSSYEPQKEIRGIIYTTNIIESVHRQFRKLTA